MNCVRCNTPLEANARFCRTCGLPAEVTFEQAQQRATNAPVAQDDVAATTQPAWFPAPQPQQPPQQWQAAPGTYNQPGTPNTIQPSSAQPAKPKRRGRLGGCLLGAFGLLAVLIIGLGAVWVFVARPYLHNLALQNLDATMTQAVNQIPSQVAQLPPGPVPIQQDALNALISFKTSPSDLVQHPAMQITQNNVQFTFQIGGQACTITGVPVAQAGQLVLTNVTVSGIIGLVLSPDDITTLVNKHLADAQARLNHQVASVQLADQLMILLLV